MNADMCIIIGFSCFILAMIWLIVRAIMNSKKYDIYNGGKVPEHEAIKIFKVPGVLVLLAVVFILIGVFTDDTSDYGNDPLNGHTQEEYDDLVHEYSKPWK